MLHDRIPNLTIETTEGGGFLLEQDCSGNVDRIELHPTQVQHLAELAGLLPRRGDPYIPPACVLARRLHVLRDRIDRLDDWLRAVAENGREDLEHELTFSFATWELATEFCADLGASTAAAASSPDSPGDRPPTQRQLQLEP